MSVNPVDHIDFEGPTWRALKMYLEQAKERKVAMLIGESTHDKSNQIRGSIGFIAELLALEKSRPTGR